ncbi:MAG TPA: DUF167 family protein [Gammaproteobacteria bacterium]
MAAWYRWQGGDLLLTLRIQPRASRDEIAGPYGDALKVRITAPPVDGKANAHLLRFLAGLFDVAPAAVELLSGETGRDKRVRISHPRRMPPEAGIPPE